MFEILVSILIVWLAFKVLVLTFKVAWGITKVIALLLFVLALPTLAVCFLFASGILFLIPLALIGAAFGLLSHGA